MAWRPFRHFGLKIAALALGTLLWFTVTQHPWFAVAGHTIERRVPVRVSYSNVPAGFEMTGHEYDDVSVRVRGAEDDVAGLTASRLFVLIDMAGAGTGANVLPLRTDEVVAPPGVEVLDVDPGNITVTLEKSGQASVAIRASIDGIPAPGYRVAQVTVDPATAVVEGPETRLESPVSVLTERVPIDGRSSTVAADVGVGVADGQLRLRAPRTAHVTIRIEPITDRTRLNP
jgi:YbbR domain-containing protein